MNTKAFSSEELRFRAVWSTCRIPPRLAGASFETYKPTCPEQERALEQCRAFAAHGLDNIGMGKGLFLKGPVGTGKSHLSVSILRAIIQNHSDRFGTPASETVSRLTGLCWLLLLCNFGGGPVGIAA
ncbi:MAG TPA: hypothetical protein VN426_04760 [Syntrophomonadaceae bacterium]|nr:hypothetical protein [Syntrophomonadaceae bacterium]